MNFDGRVAVVTGAGKGLGRAYALTLAAGGARVVVNNRSDPERVVNEIRAAGGIAVAEHSHVEDPASGERLVARALDEFGRLDIVITSAGVGQASTLHKTSSEEFRRIVEIDLFGTIHVVHAAYPLMRDAGYGRIVLNTSSAGLHGDHGMTAYAAAKGGLIAFARSLALEGAARNVLVNAVAPYAMTQMTAPYMPEEVGNHFTPEHVAPVVAWLASEDSTITGEVLIAGGGYIRRAIAMETDAAALDDTEALNHIAKLDGARPFPCAIDAFNDLVAKVMETQ
jgi:NAD(P)-dependent dehydrogenase (short-subunit alcohol dehydrogenase family)